MRKDVIDNQICQSIVAVNVVALIFRYSLTKGAASEVEELDGKAVGFSDHACKKCSEYKDKVVFFIGIDSENSPSEEVYRIGQVVGVRNGAPLIAHFSKYIRSLKDGTRFCFIDELAGKKIGLWN